MEVKKQILPII